MLESLDTGQDTAEVWHLVYFSQAVWYNEDMENGSLECRGKVCETLLRRAAAYSYMHFDGYKSEGGFLCVVFFDEETCTRNLINVYAVNGSSFKKVEVKLGKDIELDSIGACKLILDSLKHCDRITLGRFFPKTIVCANESIESLAIEHDLQDSEMKL